VPGTEDIVCRTVQPVVSKKAVPEEARALLS
jgi:hypothetical protein